jgi:hypothetical protein
MPNDLIEVPCGPGLVADLGIMNAQRSGAPVKPRVIEFGPFRTGASRSPFDREVELANVQPAEEFEGLPQNVGLIMLEPNGRAIEVRLEGRPKRPECLSLLPVGSEGRMGRREDQGCRAHPLTEGLVAESCVQRFGRVFDTQGFAATQNR